MWKLKHKLFGWHYARILYYGKPYVRRLHCKGKDDHGGIIIAYLRGSILRVFDHAAVDLVYTKEHSYTPLSWEHEEVPVEKKDNVVKLKVVK